MLCIFFPLKSDILFETKEKQKLQKKDFNTWFQSKETETEKGTPTSVEGPGGGIQWQLGLTYLKFPYRKTFNLKLRKFREEGQMQHKFPVIVKKFRYTSHGCPEIEENEAGAWY